MKTTSLPLTGLVAAGLLALAACSSTPTQQATPSAPAPTTASKPTTPQAAAPAPVAPAAQALAAHLDPNNPISRERSVYFDFDESVLKRDSLPVVERQGPYLAHNAALKIRIEGNTDERGGSEYNLALGQRRAEAVKSALQVYGVRPAQVETVSFGKERPKASGHEEPAWAQNRRADIVYVTTK